LCFGQNKDKEDKQEVEGESGQEEEEEEVEEERDGLTCSFLLLVVLTHTISNEFEESKLKGTLKRITNGCWSETQEERFHSLLLWNLDECIDHSFVTITFVNLD
jgi:hypothetical protein